MIVYLLVHERSDYDSGEFEIRGVYRHSADAKAALITKTPAGKPSKAWDAHNNSCCTVEEHDVWAAPHLDIKDDPPLPDPNATGGFLISQEMAEKMIANWGSLNPLMSMDRSGPIGRVDEIREDAHGNLKIEIALFGGKDAT